MLFNIMSYHNSIIIVLFAFDYFRRILFVAAFLLDKPMLIWKLMI
mgnify:CR=1 FL=1